MPSKRASELRLTATIILIAYNTYRCKQRCYVASKRVEVLEYDPAWASEFDRISHRLQTELEGAIECIEHVGSTSVEGLAAKPVIDIDVVIGDAADLASIIIKLSELGYSYEGDKGIAGRESFRYAGSEPLFRHHLYVCRRGSDELNRHIRFRDHLRSHWRDMTAYARVKREAACIFPDDIEGYMAYKAPVIESMYRKLGLIAGEDTDFERREMEKAGMPGVRKITCGVYVIGAKAEGRINGMTAAWVTQASMVPPMVCVSINKRHFTGELIEKAKCFSVNVLSADCRELAVRCGFGSGREVDRLSEADITYMKTGAPVLKQCAAYMDCELRQTADAGDHRIYIGEVVESGETDKAALIFDEREFF